MPTTYGSRLRAARELAGLTQQDVVFAARQALPRPMWISQTKLQRIESGEVPEEKADTFLLLFLADLYGTDLATISTAVAEDVKMVADLVKRQTGWTSQTLKVPALTGR